MSKKLNKAEAQEWLESLQQVGEGWWRQVALAVRVGAHTSLGMEQRAFAKAIGQRMIDPRPAIIELHGDGHSITTIANVLGMGKATVHNTLVEAGLIEGEIRATGGPGAFGAKQLATGGDDREADDKTGGDDLQSQIDSLAAQVEGERAKGKREAKELRKKITDLQKHLVDAERKAQEEAEANLTEADRERARKEAEAWAEEQGRKILVGFSHITVEGIVGNLEEAASEIRLLIEQQAVTEEAIDRIDSARAGFEEEFNVARMSVGTEEGRTA